MSVGAAAHCRGWKARREERTKVLIRASMRAGGPKTEICVRDISRRGLLVQAHQVPVRGTFVEIMLPDYPVAGRVMWTSDRRFGVACEQLNLDRIIKPDRRASASDPSAQPLARSNRSSTHKKSAERSRFISRWLQFVSLAALGATAAAAAGMSVYGLLSDALEPASQKFGQVR